MRTDKKGTTGVEPKTYYLEGRHLIHYVTQQRASKHSAKSDHHLKTQRHPFIVPAQVNKKTNRQHGIQQENSLDGTRTRNLLRRQTPLH